MIGARGWLRVVGLGPGDPDWLLPEARRSIQDATDLVGYQTYLDLIPDDGPADFPPYDMYPSRTEWVPPSGVLSSARGSSADKGLRMARDIVGGIADAVRKEFRL